MIERREVSWWVTRLISVLLLLNGLWILAESVLRQLPERFDKYLIADADSFSRQLAVVAGISLVYFSLKLRQGKRHAWYMALGFIALFLQYALLHPEKHPLGIGISLISLFGLLIEEKQFRVRSDTASLRQNLFNIAVIIVVALSYGTIGFIVRDERNYGRSFSVPQAFVRTVREFSLYGNADLVVRTRQARIFLDSMSVLGLTSMGFIAWSLFRPVRFAIGATASEIRRAEEILRRYSTSPEDFFKLWPVQNKHLFFNQTGSAFISYGVFGGVALMLEDPSGNPEDINALVADFMSFAHINGWLVGAIHISDKYRRDFELHGLDMIAIGEEAVVDVATFADETSRDKHFRYVRNKFTKQLITFEYLEAPHDAGLVAQLRKVSDEWLEDGSHKERTFAVGYFDDTYVSACDLAIA